MRTGPVQGLIGRQWLPSSMDASGTTIQTPVQKTSVIRLCIGSRSPKRPTKTRARKARNDRYEVSATGRTAGRSQIRRGAMTGRRCAAAPKRAVRATVRAAAVM